MRQNNYLKSKSFRQSLLDISHKRQRESRLIDIKEDEALADFDHENDQPDAPDKDINDEVYIVPKQVRAASEPD